MSLVIRNAEAGDAGLIYEFIRELAAFEKLTHEVDASQRDIEEALFGPQPRVFAEIAEWNGTPAGFALWFYNFSTFRGRHGLYLEDLFVRPEARGCGLGKALLAELARIAVARDCARLEWSVLDWNEPSIGFYKALGARPMDEWTVMRVDGGALTALAGSGAP